MNYNMCISKSQTDECIMYVQSEAIYPRLIPLMFAINKYLVLELHDVVLMIIRGKISLSFHAPL
jgi:hypothetical protein